MMMELIQKYCCDQAIADTAPELSFVWDLAKQVKQRGCYCGLNQQISQNTATFNNIVQNLSEETIKKMATFFGRSEVCFGILESNKFSTKCYSIVKLAP